MPSSEAPPTTEVTKEETEEAFNLHNTRHSGGYALAENCIHESDRLLVVKYVSPNCGPCHTLKPILNKVVDEF